MTVRSIIGRALRRAGLRRREPAAWKHFVGPYGTWEEARAASTGYNAEIFERTKAARLAVLRGEAAYERDSVLFDRMEYPWPLLACLLWVASRGANRLNLVDFGGSLGTLYFPLRPFFSHLAEFQWSIVEQDPYVDFGRQRLEDAALHFHSSLDECLERREPTAALLSGVLMYVERPHDVLATLRRRGLRYLVVDRTGFVPGARDILTVQNIPPHIFRASYPSWFFGLDAFKASLPEYRPIVEFDSTERADWEGSFFKGFLFERK